MSLLKISLIISFIGLFVIFTLSYIQPTKTITISEIKNLPLDTKIKTIATITSTKETTGLYILNLKDSTDSIQAIIFKKSNLTLKNQQLIEIHGKTTSYKNQTQIQVSLIRK